MTPATGRGPGCSVDGRVVDAWAALGEPHRGSLRELIAHGRVDDLRGAARRHRGAVAPASARCALLPPIPDPDKIVCIGLNYAQARGRGGGMEPPASPTIFGKYRNALAAAGRDGDAARQQPQGRLRGRGRLRRRPARQATVDEADALDFIAGYTLFNDLSARDLQFATPQWMSGKVFDGSAPCGPALVTPDEAGPRRRDRDQPDPERRDRCRATRPPNLIFSIPRAALPPLRG